MKPLDGLVLVAGVLGLGGCNTILPQPSDLFQLNNEAQLSYESGEDAKAEAQLKALARAVPQDFEVWFRLGNLYARSNRPDAAADAYQRALSINSAEARAWHNLGVVRLRQGWAAMVQSYSFSDGRDPLRQQTESIVNHLSKMPLVAAPVPAGADRREGGEAR